MIIPALLPFSYDLCTIFARFSHDLRTIRRSEENGPLILYRYFVRNDAQTCVLLNRMALYDVSVHGVQTRKNATHIICLRYSYGNTNNLVSLNEELGTREWRVP